MPHLKKAIVLFKYRSSWEHFLLDKLSHSFNINVIYLDELIRRYGFSTSISEINALVRNGKIEFIFIDAEFYPAVDKQYIESLSNEVVKIAVYFDDILMHDFNAITSSAVDVVLVADPIAALKYREKGIASYYFPLESSAKFFKKCSKKSIDVLFFGDLEKADRREWVSFLKSAGVSLTVVGPHDGFVSFEELASIISSSRIVLDLSKSSNMCVQNLHDASRRGVDYFCYYYQMKGRAIMAGLSGVCCISERTPAIGLLFSEDEVPTFANRQECLNLIQLLLGSEKMLSSCADKLSSKVSLLYEDSPLMKRLEPLLAKRDVPLECSNKLPIWYKNKVLVAKLKIALSVFKRKIQPWAADNSPAR